MAASDHLGLQFSSVPVPFAEHKGAIEDFHAKDPSNTTVSVPEDHPDAQSFAVQDQHGSTHGYYQLKPQAGGLYLGGLAATSGAKGISGHVLGTMQNKDSYLDGYDRPEIGGNYAKSGKPDYLDMKRPAMRGRGNVSVSQAHSQLPANDKPDNKPDYA